MAYFSKLLLAFSKDQFLALLRLYCALYFIDFLPSLFPFFYFGFILLIFTKYLLIFF